MSKPHACPFARPLGRRLLDVTPRALFRRVRAPPGTVRLQGPRRRAERGAVGCRRGGTPAESLGAEH